MEAMAISPLKATLTFAWLYQRVQDHITATGQSAPPKFERWAFWMGIGSAGMGLIVGTTWNHWLSSTGASRIMMVLLSTELVGLLVFVVSMIRRELPQFLRSRQVHSDEMDEDYRKWRELVADLRQFPLDQRQARLRFVRALRSNMENRMGLVFGGVQRLGVLPLLIALYLQFRNWEWGDWAAAFDVHLLAGLLIWAMLLLYGMGWLLVGLRTRLDTYESLLQESLEDAA